MITSAFTCTGPYAILIMMGVKKVENRSAMPVPARGRCAVSCSKSFCKEEFGEFVRWAAIHLQEEDFERLPSWCDVKDWPGKIVGCCDYEARQATTGMSSPRADEVGAKCRTPRASSPVDWDEGYGCWWELSETVSFDKPIPCRGNVGMWQLPPALAARVSAADAQERLVGEVVVTADDAARVFRGAVSIAGGNEGFFVLPLDVERRALSTPILVSLGEPATTTVDVGEVFSAALGVGAKTIIVAHNHPSGDPKPSRDDVEMTRKLMAGAELLGVRLLDHLIIGSPECENGRGFVSIMEQIENDL